MKFLKNWTIDPSKIPAYATFKSPFTLDLDQSILNIMSNHKDSNFNEDRLKLLQPIISAMNGNQLKIKHNNRFNMGRFYANNSISPICVSRHIKHTLFHYLDWVDIDMVKGHPSILYSIAKNNGIELPTMKMYLDNPDSILKQLIDFYSCENKLTTNDVKGIFNIKIYGGNHNTWIEAMGKEGKEISTNSIHPIEAAYDDEIKTIINIVYLNNKAIADIIKGDETNEYKIKNKVMSYFCGTIENEILYITYKFLVSKNIIEDKKCALEYDGLCFKKPDGIDMSEIILELNHKIKKDTNLDVKMKLKGYDPEYVHQDIINERNRIEIKEDFINEIISNKSDDSFNDSFDKLAETFEQNHVKILNRSCFIKTTENDNIIMSKQMIKTSYEHMVYYYEDKDGLTKTKNFINKWLNDNPTQKCYDDIAIYPNEKLCPPTHFNMWRKFPMEIIDTYEPKIEERNFILNHIKILCNHDLVVYNYFIKWIAQMIIFPDVKTTCPTFISQEGAGKGSLIRLFEKMLGDCKVFETTKPSRDVWGDFNGRMANTFLIILNELSKKETLEAEGYIKGLITDPKLTINNKGSNQFDITSYHRFIVCTNKEEPFNTNKDDRRKWFVRCSDELIGNKEYFNKYYEYLNDINIVKTMFEYFKNIPDTENFNKIPLPVTEYHQGLMEYAKCPIERWLEDFTYKNQDEDFIELKTESVLEKFNKWCSENGIEYKLDSLKLCVRMSRLKINGIEKKKTNKFNATTFDINKMKAHFKIDCLL